MTETTWHRRDLAISVALFCGFALLAYVLQSDQFGLLDWDTYGRIRFLPLYGTDFIDSHVLYHRLAVWLIGAGCSPLTALCLLNGAAYGLFVALLYWLSRDAGLSRRSSAIVLLVAVLGSPGLMALLLSVEDNVAYFPAVLLFFAFMTRAADGVPRNVRLGAYAGIALAAGMLISISLLFFLFALLTTPVLVWIGKREHALRIVTMIVVALAAYYLTFLMVLPEDPIALPSYLLKAWRLEDFEQSTTPLWSLDRLQQAFGGFRATAWLPTLNFIWIGDELREVVYFIPWLLAAIYVGLAGYHVVSQRKWVACRWRALLIGAIMYALALLFPVTYEPYLIERWDILWIGLLVLLARLLSRDVPAWTHEILAAQLCVHVAATALVIANHYGMTVGPFEQGWQLVNGRAYVGFVQREKVDVLFLPGAVDRMQAVYVLHHIAPVPIFLVKPQGQHTGYVLFDPVGERVVSPEWVSDVISRTGHVAVDPAVHERVQRDFPVLLRGGEPELLIFRR